MTPNEKTLLAAVTAAKAKLAEAKTDEELAAANAALTDAINAKMKYSKRTRTDELEEDDGESSEAPSTQRSSEAPSADEESAAESAEESASESAEESAEGEEAEEEDSRKARSKALKAMRARPTTAAAVYDAIFALTGKANLNEALGALEGIKTRLAGAAKLEKRVEKLESTSRKDRVGSMLSKAQAEGRIAKNEVESLRAAGMRDPKWLKGNLSARPRGSVVRTVEDGPVAPQPTERTAELSIATMSKEERDIYETAARAMNLSLDKYLEHAKTIAPKFASARPTH